jgi:hypothetical protein
MENFKAYLNFVPILMIDDSINLKLKTENKRSERKQSLTKKQKKRRLSSKIARKSRQKMRNKK